MSLEPALYKDSPLKELQDLADKLYARMGKTPYSWENKTLSVIKVIDLNKVNEVIDAVSNDYSAGHNSQSCGTRYGINHSTNGYDEDGCPSYCSSNKGSQRTNICSPRDSAYSCPSH